MSSFKKALEKLHASPSLLSEYNEGVSKLYSSGVVDCLRALSIPSIEGRESNTQALATEAAFKNGMALMLEYVLNFKEYWVIRAAKSEGAGSVSADYGAINNLLKDKRITEEQAHELRKRLFSRAGN